MVLSTLDNGLLLLGVQSFWQDVATGSLLVIAVTFQNYRFLVDRFSGRFGRRDKLVALEGSEERDLVTATDNLQSR